MRELPDRWQLGLRVTKVLGVHLDGESCVLRLTGGATVSGTGEIRLTYGPTDRLPVDDLLRLVDAEVLSAVAFKSGTLRLVFNSAHHLRFRQRSTRGAGRRQVHLVCT